LSTDLKEALNARVQKVDPARTLAARLAPKLEADRLIGLYAFQYEIARVSESVSEPMLGAIRLQWWREAVDEIRVGKPVRARDTAQALEDAFAPIKFTFPLSLLDEMIDARERDLDDAPFETIQSLNDYAAATAGTLTLAAASALSKDTIAEIVQVGLRNAGRAWGLAGLARETAIAEQFDARPRLPIRIGAADIAAEARVAYDAAKRQLRGAPAELLPAYAYVTLVPSLTRRFTLEAASPLAMRWRILKSAITGSI
jgi:phytoene synthase